jgi:hypothetical protein
MIEQKYLDWEKQIDAGEKTSLRARWECGKALLEERKGNDRLPNGRLVELATFLKKSETELKYRMQFAEKFPLEEELVTVVTSFCSWSELRDSFSVKETQAYSKGESQQDLLNRQEEKELTDLFHTHFPFSIKAQIAQKFNVIFSALTKDQVRELAKILTLKDESNGH